MKKLHYLFILIFTMFSCVHIILADNLKCEYQVEENAKLSILPDYVLTFNNAGDVTDEFSNHTWSTDMIDIKDSFKNYFYSSDWNKNECLPKIYVCLELITTYYCDDFDSNNCYTISYNDYILYKDVPAAQSDGKETEKNCSWSINKSSSGSLEYFKNSDNDGELSTDPDTYCPTYDIYLNKIKDSYKSYKDCGSNSSCKISELNAANSNNDKLKSVCTSVISKLDYNDSCVTRCLQLNKEITRLKHEYEIIPNSSNKDCKLLTDQIISFIYNILKWIKYIIPPLVIILNIMDLIKAVASSSEDAMKKAQGRFIKRLIVAALIFLLPLIINFLLKTFGLYNSACDFGSIFS